MPPKISNASLSTKKSKPMSKMEQKMALVSQRLAMLQDDGQNHNSSIVVSDVTPLQYESKSTLGVKEKLKNVSDDSQQKICGSTSPVIELDEDSASESEKKRITSGPSVNRNKYGSHEQVIVVSADNSEEELVQPMKKESHKPAIVVSDVNSDEELIQPMKKERGTKRKKVTFNDTINNENVYGASDNSRNLKKEEKFSTTMERAIKVQANLSAAQPSFIKTMLPSHVSGGFWLGLSRKFCDLNLPEKNCDVVLVDEGGREFKTIYLAHKTGLSGGWKGFSVHHALQKGDVLVFHLIHPTTFKVHYSWKRGVGVISDLWKLNLDEKVYIVREDRLDEVDGALGLLGLDTSTRQMISAGSTQKVLHTEDSPPMDSLSPINSDNEIQPEVLDGICYSDTDINFEAIKGFDDFKINVDGLIIDSKFSESNRKKYYELCHSQNSYLHQQLLKGLNCNLVVGIILETVNIADAIKACNSSTSIDDLKTWKKTLNGFELLGMNVNFLCAKLNQLLGTAMELDSVNASNRLENCRLERSSASSRMKALEDKLAELKRVMEKIDLEIEDEMTTSVEKHKAKIKEIANTPW